jgi:type I restriction enzyme S subunit
VTKLPNGWAEATLGDVALLNPSRGDAPPPDALVAFVPMASVEAETGRLASMET